MYPALSQSASPYGAPPMITGSPTCTWFESPILATLAFAGTLSSCSSDKSAAGSDAMTWAATVSPPRNSTSIWSMLWTTCAAVITLPSGVTSTPDPVSLNRDWPLVVTSRPRALMTTTVALTWSNTSRTVWASTVAALDMRVAIITAPTNVTAINNDPLFPLVPAILALLSLPVPVEVFPVHRAAPTSPPQVAPVSQSSMKRADAPARTLSRIVGGPVDQGAASSRHGLTAVTHGMLGLGGDFCKRGAKRWIVEDGIVAEPTVPAWRLQNQAVDDALGRRLVTVRRAEGDHAAVSRGALCRRNAAKLTEHVPPSILVVEAIAAVPSREHAGPPTERIDFDPRVVGECQRSGRLRDRARLQERIVLIRRLALGRQRHRRESPQDLDAVWNAGEERSEFAALGAVGRRKNERSVRERGSSRHAPRGRDAGVRRAERCRRPQAPASRPGAPWKTGSAPRCPGPRRTRPRPSSRRSCPPRPSSPPHS